MCVCVCACAGEYMLVFVHQQCLSVATQNIITWWSHDHLGRGGEGHEIAPVHLGPLIGVNGSTCCNFNNCPGHKCPFSAVLNLLIHKPNRGLFPATLNHQQSRSPQQDSSLPTALLVCCSETGRCSDSPGVLFTLPLFPLSQMCRPSR